MFKKLAVFTDIHFGKKGDSEQHNLDCLRYIDWFVTQVAENQCDTILFMGDFFENPSKIGVQTLNMALEGIRRLRESAVPIFWLVGNHDMFHRSSRDVHSVSFLEQMEGVHLINKVTLIDDVLLCPYLVGTEHVEVVDTKAKYVFGHFALPLFLVNEGREMPDNGALHGDFFYQCEMVFSGHFHLRQMRKNSNDIPIWYIGNTFPMDFHDKGDRSRGCMILEWDEMPVFLDWPEAPNYNRLAVSELITMLDEGRFEKVFNKFSIVEAVDDVGITPEDVLELKNLTAPLVREIWFPPKVQDENIEAGVDHDVTIENVADLVHDHLSKFETRGDGITNALLIDIWEGKGKSHVKGI